MERGLSRAARFLLGDATRTALARGNFEFTKRLPRIFFPGGECPTAVGVGRRRRRRRRRRRDQPALCTDAHRQSDGRRRRQRCGRGSGALPSPGARACGLCSRGAFRQRQLPRRTAATSPGRRASELSADGAIAGGAIGGGAAHGLGARHLEAVEAPVAKRVPHEVKFGKVDGENKGDNPMDPPKVWTDDLYWMRDDERKSEDVLSHLRAENAHTASVMGPTEDAQKALYAELRSHIKVRERHFSERHFLGSFLVYPS